MRNAGLKRIDGTIRALTQISVTVRSNMHGHTVVVRENAIVYRPVVVRPTPLIRRADLRANAITPTISLDNSQRSRHVIVNAIIRRGRGKS